MRFKYKKRKERNTKGCESSRKTNKHTDRQTESQTKKQRQRKRDRNIEREKGEKRERNPSPANRSLLLPVSHWRPRLRSYRACLRVRSIKASSACCPVAPLDLLGQNIHEGESGGRKRLPFVSGNALYWRNSCVLPCFPSQSCPHAHALGNTRACTPTPYTYTHNGLS